MQNVWSVVHYYHETQMANDLKLLQVCKFMYVVDLHKVLTLPATVLFEKPIL